MMRQNVLSKSVHLPKFIKCAQTVHHKIFDHTEGSSVGDRLSWSLKTRKIQANHVVFVSFESSQRALITKGPEKSASTF